MLNGGSSEELHPVFRPVALGSVITIRVNVCLASAIMIITVQISNQLSKRYMKATHICKRNVLL